MSARNVVLLFVLFTLSTGPAMFTSCAATGAGGDGLTLKLGVFDSEGNAVNGSGPGRVLRISGEAALAPGAPAVPSLSLTLSIDGKQRERTGPWELENSSERALLECLWTPGQTDIGPHIIALNAVDEDDPGAVNCTATVTVQVLSVVVSGVTVVPSPALEGDEVCITAELFNYGSTGFPGSTVTFSEGFQRIGTVYGVDVPACGTANASCKWVLPRVRGGDEHIVVVASVDGSQGMAGVVVKERISRIELGPVALGYGLEAGQDLAFDIAVRNNGTEAARGLQAEFLEDGLRLCITAPFDLAPGGNISVPMAFSIFGPENMTHDFMLRVGGVEMSTKRLLGLVPTPANIRLADFFVDPEHMDGKPPGSTQVASLIVLLNNTGEQNGTVLLTIVENRTVIVNRSITLAGGQKSWETYNWPVSGAVTHRAVARLTGDAAWGQDPLETDLVLRYSHGERQQGVDSRVLLVSAGLFLTCTLFALGTFMGRHRKTAEMAAVNTGRRLVERGRSVGPRARRRAPRAQKPVTGEHGSSAPNVRTLMPVNPGDLSIRNSGSDLPKTR